MSMAERSGGTTSTTLLGKLRHNPADQSAWDAFAARYGPQIYLWCRRWQLQDADAQDIAQTVLATLLKKMRDFVYDPSGSFRGWLKTVTRNAWLKCLDRRKRSGMGDHSHTAQLETLEGSESLEAHLEAEYDRELLELAILRVAQRVESHTLEAFRLTALEGKTAAEVADRLGMKIPAVYVARKRVQDALRQEVRLLDE
jgi:RNA polymerase sigma-70 factor (ECF subfamily)